MNCNISSSYKYNELNLCYEYSDSSSFVEMWLEVEKDSTSLIYLLIFDDGERICSFVDSSDIAAKFPTSKLYTDSFRISLLDYYSRGFLNETSYHTVWLYPNDSLTSISFLLENSDLKYSFPQNGKMIKCSGEAIE